MTDPYQGPVLTLKLQGRINKNSVKINKIQIFDLIFYFIKSIIIFGNFMGIHYDYKSTRGAVIGGFSFFGAVGIFLVSQIGQQLRL